MHVARKGIHKTKIISHVAHKLKHSHLESMTAIFSTCRTSTQSEQFSLHLLDNTLHMASQLLAAEVNQARSSIADQEEAA